MVSTRTGPVWVAGAAFGGAVAAAVADAAFAAPGRFLVRGRPRHHEPEQDDDVAAGKLAPGSSSPVPRGVPATPLPPPRRLCPSPSPPGLSSSPPESGHAGRDAGSGAFGPVDRGTTRVSPVIA